jgi:hypothetical protein
MGDLRRDDVLPFARPADHIDFGVQLDGKTGCASFTRQPSEQLHTV